MSINDVHEEMMANLSSAMDMGKFLGVFNTLIGVIRDQQNKIEELSSRGGKMQALIEENATREPAPSKVEVQQVEASNNELVQQLLNKIDALEGKLNDTLLDLHGFGEDKSILDREDNSADFISMANNPTEPAVAVGLRKFHTSVPSINEDGNEDVDEGGNEGEGGEEGSRVSSAVASARNSGKNSQSNSRGGSAANSRPSSRGDSRVPSRRSSGRKSPSNEIAEEDVEEIGEKEVEAEPELEELAVAAEDKDSSSAAVGAESDVTEEVQPEDGSTSAKQSRSASPYVPIDANNAASRSNTRPNTGRKSVTIKEPEGSDSHRGTPTKTLRSQSQDQNENNESNESNGNLSVTDSVDWQERSPSPSEPSDPSKLAPHALAKQTQAKINRVNTTSPGNNNQPKGLLQVTPLELRPSTMQHSFSTKMNQQNFLFPNMETQTVSNAPVDVKAQWKASIAAGNKVYVIWFCIIIVWLFYSPKLFSMWQILRIVQLLLHSAKRITLHLLICNLFSALHNTLLLPGQEPKQQPHLHRRIVPHYSKHLLDTRHVPLERLRALADYKEIRAHDLKDKIEVISIFEAVLNADVRILVPSDFEAVYRT